MQNNQIKLVIIISAIVILLGISICTNSHEEMNKDVATEEVTDTVIPIQTLEDEESELEKTDEILQEILENKANHNGETTKQKEETESRNEEKQEELHPEETKPNTEEENLQGIIPSRIEVYQNKTDTLREVIPLPED